MSVDWRATAGNDTCVGCGAPLRLCVRDVLEQQYGGLTREIRRAQIDMGTLVEQVFAERGVTLIEGPVGVGKSMAYMVPAILSDKRVLVTTAKKALQHQLASDVPRLLAGLDRPRTPWVLLKGKGNYACLLAAQGYALKCSADERTEVSKLVEWIKAAGDDADESHLPGMRPHFWSACSASECVGKRACPIRDRCAYMRARTSLANARIVVTNQHLLGVDIMLGGPGSFVLAPAEGVIIDEAHQLVSSLRSVWSTELSPGVITYPLSKMRGYDQHGDVRKPLSEAWDAMWLYAKRCLTSDERRLDKAPFREEDVDAVRTQVAAAIQMTLDELAVEDKVARRVSELSDAPEESTVEIQDAHRAYAALTKLERSLATIATYDGDADKARALYAGIRREGKRLPFARLVPVDVAAELTPRLRAFPGAVVVTSGTLAVGGKLDHFAESIGVSQARLGKPVHHLILPSVFNLEAQACLYQPDHLPLPVSGDDDTPGRAEWVNAVCEDCTALINASRGNALILCTAEADARAFRAILARQVTYPLIMQESGVSPQAVLSQFMRTAHSTMIGLKSFWEGIDVPGQKLRLVIVPKLPFPNPKDPMIEAERRLVEARLLAQGVAPDKVGGMAFRLVDEPRMITALRQGGGRVIRTMTDKGVFALLDVRSYTGGAYKPKPGQDLRGYGARAVEALGFTRRRRTIPDVLTYLSGLAAGDARDGLSAAVEMKAREAAGEVALVDEE